MTKGRIGILGYGPLGMRLADGLARHEHLCLTSVFEQDPNRVKLLEELDLPSCGEHFADWAIACDLIVATEPPGSEVSVPVLWGPSLAAECSRLFQTGPLDWSFAWRIPCADALGLARLLELTGPVRQVFSSCARRTGAATDHRVARVDALEPLFGLMHEDSDLQDYLQSLAGSIAIRRTRIPYTHSHVHHLKIDLTGGYEHARFLEALVSSSRIRVAAGYANTGQVQEFDRDLGRPRGDRPEIFVWKETIAIVGKSLFLTMDVDPEATFLPESLDVLCQFAKPELTTAEVRSSTDAALELGAFT